MKKKTAMIILISMMLSNIFNTKKGKEFDKLSYVSKSVILKKLK